MKGAPFLGGTKPNLGDLAAFGVLRAVCHTPTFEDAMAHSKIKPWFERMEQQVSRVAILCPAFVKPRLCSLSVTLGKYYVALVADFARGCIVPRAQLSAAACRLVIPVLAFLLSVNLPCQRNENHQSNDKVCCCSSCLQTRKFALCSVQTFVYSSLNG